MPFRRWLRAYGDTVLAGALAVGWLVELTGAGVLPGRPTVGGLALLASLPLAYRRRLPLASFLVLWSALLSASTIVDGLPDTSLVFLLVFFFSLYSLGAHTRGFSAWIGGVLTAIGIGMFVASDGDTFEPGDILFGAVLVGGPWAAGLAMRLKRDRERELTAHTERLEHGRAELARAAVAEERRRIARELHDVVSHAISVTVLQARGGRRMLDMDPAQARDAFSTIEHTNAQALSDMRRLLALLNDSDTDAAQDPLPTIAMLGTLVAGVRSSGLEVQLDVTGDTDAIPPGIGLSAYRIVQEALTNVLRHAAAGRAEVAVRCRERDLEVVVFDNGDGVDAASPGSGHGLIGMRERVAVAGGELETGRHEGGGFRVRARLPYRGGRVIRVALADDQALVRAGFRMILRAEPDVTVVAEAANGLEAAAAAEAHRPDVVLMDVRMPELDGIEATARIAKSCPETRVLVLTTFDLDEVVYGALRAGASGFLLKDAPEERLLMAIRVVADGGSLFAPSVTRRLIEEFSRHGPSPAPASLSELTAKEVEVLTLIARGLTNAEIARSIYITENTVKTHVARILMKLDLRDRVQAVVLAYESGLVRPQG